jgi:hypothetical protein
LEAFSRLSVVDQVPMGLASELVVLNDAFNSACEIFVQHGGVF